jgi:hypothetical protein
MLPQSDIISRYAFCFHVHYHFSSPESCHIKKPIALHGFWLPPSAFLLHSSVPDPNYFVPDPRILTSDYRIRIRLRLLLFSSVTFNTPTKNNFFCFLLFFSLKEVTKQDPGGPKACGCYGSGTPLKSKGSGLLYTSRKQ